jgi:hypothetical protein
MVPKVSHVTEPRIDGSADPHWLEAVASLSSEIAQVWSSDILGLWRCNQRFLAVRHRGVLVLDEFLPP